MYAFMYSYHIQGTVRTISTLVIETSRNYENINLQSVQRSLCLLTMSMFSSLFKKNATAVQAMTKVTQNIAQSVALKQTHQQKEDDSSSDEGEDNDDSPEVAK